MKSCKRECLLSIARRQPPARLFAVFLITGVRILVVLIILGAFTLFKLLFDSISG